jgi:hypothetical protein
MVCIYYTRVVNQSTGGCDHGFALSLLSYCQYAKVFVTWPMMDTIMLMESTGVADIIRLKDTVANLNHQSIINMKAIDWNHESSSDHLTRIEAHRGDGDSGELRRWRWRRWSLGTPLGQRLGVLLLLTSLRRHWSLRRAHLTLSLILRRRCSGQWRR